MKNGRLSATNFNGEVKLSALLETILVVCDSRHTDKDVRAIIKALCLSQIDEQGKRDKRFKTTEQ